MKRFYTLLCAAFIAVAAMAQAQHPAVIKGMPRINPAVVQPIAPQAAKAQVKKAGGQVLPINMADPVKLYTDDAYSWDGHHDYYFSFANTDDEFFFPMVFFDLYLPTADGLEEGTYTMSGGTVDPNLMLMANYNDYVYYYYGYAAYEWADATISLTKAEGDDAWTVDFSATSVDDYTYTFSFTGVLPVEPDDFDPDAVEPEPEQEYTYDYEPATASDMDIVFEVPDCSDSYVDEYHIYDIYLDSKQKDAMDRNYEGRLYLITTEHTPHADFYPVNTSEAENTFLASLGCPVSSSNDVPCYIRTYDSSYVYDSWYIVAGYINLGYDADGQMTLEGNVETYNGSHVRFTTSNLDTEGILSPLADNASLRTAKELRNGQFYIRKDAKTYNVLGQRRR